MSKRHNLLQLIKNDQTKRQKRDKLVLSDFKKRKKLKIQRSLSQYEIELLKKLENERREILSEIYSENNWNDSCSFGKSASQKEKFKVNRWTSPYSIYY